MLLYSNSTKSIAHTIGTISGITMNVVKARFSKNFFKYTYIDTRSISITRQDKKKPVIGFKYPAIAFKPEFIIDENLYPQQEMRNISIDIFEDLEDGLKIAVDLDRIRVNFEIKLKLETRLKMYDTLNYMKNKFPFNNFVSSDTIFIENTLPNDLVELTMKLKGFNLDLEGIQKFVGYLNSVNGNSDFSYKKNQGTGNYSVFMVYPTSFQMYFDGMAQGETGMKNNISADNYITMNTYVELWSPAAYKLTGEETTLGDFTLLKVDRKYIDLDENDQFMIRLNYFIELYRYLILRIGDTSFNLLSNLNGAYADYINNLAALIAKYKSEIAELTSNYKNGISAEEFEKYDELSKEFFSTMRTIEASGFVYNYISLKPINGLFPGNEMDYNLDYDINNLSLIIDNLKKSLQEIVKRYFPEDITNILHPNNPDNPAYNEFEDITLPNSIYNPANTNSPIHPDSIHSMGRSLYDIESRYETTGEYGKEDLLESKIESDLNKIIVNFSIYGKNNLIVDGRKLFFDQEFLSDVNVAIDRLDMSELFSDTSKDVINYVNQNKLNINDIFTLYLRQRGSGGSLNKSIPFRFKWETYSLNIDYPLYNTTYDIAVYYDEVLYNEILQKINT